MGKQELCNEFYDIANIVTIKIIMPADEWEELRIAEPNGKLCNHEYTEPRYDWYKTTAVEISGSIMPKAAKIFKDVGIKKKSYCGSFSKSKPALKLHFSRNLPKNESLIEGLIGTQHIVLNNCKQDRSYIRQPLGYALFRLSGLPYSRCNFSQVYVNGNFLGLFVNVEPIEKRHIKNNFKDNDEGNLYEIEEGEDFTSQIAASDRLKFEGFSDYEDKRDFKLAVQEIENSGIDGMAYVIDLKQYVRFLAMEILLKHWDGYNNKRNNTYIYNDVKAVANPKLNDVKFKFIPWGLDQILQPAQQYHFYNSSILGQIAQTDSLRSALDDEIRYLTATVFNWNIYDQVVMPLIDQMKAILLGENLPGIFSDSSYRDRLSSYIEEVREEVNLVRSGAFQLFGVVSTDSVLLLDKKTGNCIYARPPRSSGETFHETNHMSPTTSASNRWKIVLSIPKPKYLSDSREKVYELINERFQTHLHCRPKDPSGFRGPEVCHSKVHPNDGNYFFIEPLKNIIVNKFSGYFRLKSCLTGSYLYLSDTGSIANRRNLITQVDDKTKATIFYML